ncbi:CLUMA_CG019412, isoform A [Clunio marinus]|uniref:CLUMA_CG019412, isoform A n=1 Tax=Clunio marinus TaxID=568069 RepID=A0A1J1J418_9DIPT|nr:CLUMA_CG019412, isoform A [Clunio marinus]
MPNFPNVLTTTWNDDLMNVIHDLDYKESKWECAVAEYLHELQSTNMTTDLYDEYKEKDQRFAWIFTIVLIVFSGFMFLVRTIAVAGLYDMDTKNSRDLFIVRFYGIVVAIICTIYSDYKQNERDYETNRYDANDDIRPTRTTTTRTSNFSENYTFNNNRPSNPPSAPPQEPENNNTSNFNSQPTTSRSHTPQPHRSPQKNSEDDLPPSYSEAVHKLM